MKVSIVGAGPGNIELLTLGAVNALETANIVLYDALVNPQILERFAPQAEWIYVGKRSGKHSYTQTEIHTLYTSLAGSVNHIVRLKGGDPFVFGRSSEELEHLRSLGIEPVIVPGVSSATALTGLQKIALTERGIAESFWVITGTKEDLSLSEDLTAAAHTSATVVVLMGVSKLPEIVHTYSSIGKQNLPVAIIQNGSLENEKVVYGTISSIQSIAQTANIGTPAIIVIGETVANEVQIETVKTQISQLETISQ